MNPFFGMPEQQEIVARRFCRERFEALFIPLAAYCESALQALDPGNRDAVIEKAEALRSVLQPHGDAIALLVLLHAITREGDEWYRRHLAPLEATSPFGRRS